MKRLNIYSAQKVIFLVIGLVGIAGTLALIGKLIFKWDIDLFSVGIYPIFLFNFYQYLQAKKKFFSFSNSEITWQFMGMKTSKKLVFTTNQPSFTLDWKGLKVTDGEQSHEISLDGLWKRDRKKIITELQAFYQ